MTDNTEEVNFDFLEDIGSKMAESEDGSEPEDVMSEPIEEPQVASKESDSDFDPFADLEGGEEESVEAQDSPMQEPSESIPTPLPNGDIKLPSLNGDGFPPAYMGIVNGILYQYSHLPQLDYDEIYAELSDLSVKSCPTPTIQVINDEIQKVQAAKDRLSEIYCQVLRNYFFKKRAVDILESAWAKYTTEKNTEKRKGDAVFRTSEFASDYAAVESLAKVCQHVLKNLDSLHESLSRRITVNQILLKLNDIGRSSLPFQDYNMGSESPLTEEVISDIEAPQGNPEELDEENF